MTDIVVPKVGEKYAVLGANGRVTGPHYVVNTRGQRVALMHVSQLKSGGFTPGEIINTAARGWKSRANGTLESIGSGWNTASAVPWTDEHAETVLRERMVARVSGRFERAQSHRFKDIDFRTLSEIARMLEKYA